MFTSFVAINWDTLACSHVTAALLSRGIESITKYIDEVYKKKAGIRMYNLVDSSNYRSRYIAKFETQSIDTSSIRDIRRSQEDQRKSGERR